jgi:hypothetical protein
MPRFVILRHVNAQGVHFDFMLEVGDVLKTWALPDVPRMDIALDCEVLADHRLAYLDYEGPISGDRGVVTRWDSGTYTLERQADEEWSATLAGERLAGRVTLRRAADAAQRWRFSLAQLD